MVSFITANDITITDLSKSSLPKLLEYVLSQKEILEYSSLEYFSFTPEETTMDFDFIRCYNILSKFLMIFKLSSHNVKQSIVEIGELLNEIKNNETLNSIIIDLFSLIFLQKNEKYICTLFITKELLSLLNKFSQRLSKAYALVQKAESFESLFVKDPKKILNEIQMEHWEIANNLTLGLLYYRKLFLLAYAIYSICMNSKIPKELEGKINLLNVELYFSSCSQEIKQNIKHSSDENLSNIEMIDFNIETTDKIKLYFSDLSDVIGLSKDKLDSLFLTHNKQNPDIEKWKIVEEYVNLFEKDPIENMMSNKINKFTFSKNLHGFIKYLTNFYFNTYDVNYNY